MPRCNSYGRVRHYDRAYSTAPDWAYNDKEINNFFVTLTQRFADNWQATLNATHTNIKFYSQMMYLGAVVNKETGQLVGLYVNYGAGYDYVGGTGWNTGERKVDSVDLFTDSKYELLGSQHTVMLGGSYSRQTNRYLNTWANIYPDELGSFYDYDGNFPETQWDQQTVAHDDKTYIKSLYAATRISLADPLNLIIGARYTNWRIDAMTHSMYGEKTHSMYGEKPYFALCGFGI